MSFTRISSVDGCAEVVLYVAREMGLRVEIFEPDIQRPVTFKITASSKAQYRSAQHEWSRRLYVGNLDGTDISKEEYDKLHARLYKGGKSRSRS